MDESEVKIESKCVCVKCSAVFPFFSINNYEFRALFYISSTIDQNRYDEYISFCKLSKLTANLNKNNFLIDVERIPDTIAILEIKLNANNSFKFPKL